MFSAGRAVERVDDVWQNLGIVLGVGMGKVFVESTLEVSDEALSNTGLGFRCGLELLHKILLQVLPH